MKWQRHEDGDIILAVVIICALAGLARLARWWWKRILVRAFDRGYSLGLLRGCTQRLGRRTGWNLQDFMEMYEEKVSGSELPESPELRRTVFRPDPRAHPGMHERLCERWAGGGDRHVVRHGHNGPGRRPGGVEGRPLRPVREARQVRGRAEGRVGGQGPGRKPGIRPFRLAEGRPGPRQVEETNMTVNELVQELQRPDLAVHIPCPHCCGQRGADFDLLDAEHVVQMERDGRQVGLLGDTRQQCLEDRRSDSRTRVRTAAAGRASELAAGLGLQYVRTLTRTDFERMYQDIREGHHIGRSRSSRLLRTNLVIEATDGQDTHYVMVETPFRASPEDIALVRMGVGLMTELTGCASHAVVACVVRDSSAEADIASGQVHWHLMEPGDLETE